jgi:sugar phosphate isomerase/epimerase
MRFSSLLLTSVTQAAAAWLLIAPCTQAASTGTGPSFKGPVGLQLYSLRNQFAKDIPDTLDKVKAFGFQYVELAGTYGQTPAQFKAALDARGLKPVGDHFPFDEFRTNIDAIVREAKALGLKNAGCAWIPHDDKAPFTEARCREAIDVFNHAGEVLAKNGIHFYYHCHGYEFVPHGQGTLFDLLMTETKPKFVSFEMDIFWVFHAGQDPVQLLAKYGKRWTMMHLKGMREGTPTGLLTGHSSITNDVPVGTGKMDCLPILREAKKIGVKWYIIEDESPDSEQQIPQSLRYLETVSF